MRIRTLLVAASLALILPFAAQAQTISTRASAGIFSPDLPAQAGTVWGGTGYTLALGARQPITPFFALRGDATLDFFPADWSVVAPGVEGGDMMGAGLLLGAEVSFPTPAARPYALAEVGYISWSATDLEYNGETAPLDDLGSDFAWAVGAGVQFSAFFLEATYVTADEATWVPIRFGLEF